MATSTNPNSYELDVIFIRDPNNFISHNTSTNYLIADYVGIVGVQLSYHSIVTAVFTRVHNNVITARSITVIVTLIVKK